MKKITLLSIAVLSLFSTIISCQKGELVDSYQSFVNLTISGLEPGIDVYCNGLEVSLPHVPTGQVNLSLVESSTGATIFENQYDFFEDHTLYYFQQQLLSNPQDTMEALANIVQLRMANFSDQLSPDGSPIHLAFQQSLGIDWGLFAYVYSEEIDTIRNVGAAFGDTYHHLRKDESPLTSNIYEARAKVLNEDESPLLIEGKEVYIWFAAGDATASIITAFIPMNEELILFPGDDFLVPFNSWYTSALPILFEN